MDTTIAVILAGGRGSRMAAAQPKHRLLLNRRTLLDHVLARITGQVDRVVLNTNDVLDTGDLTVVTDRFDERPGPLAGVHAALCWLRENRLPADGIYSVPCDTPWFPGDLVAQLRDCATGHNDIVFAGDASRDHPVFARWPLAILDALETALRGSSGLSLQRFAETVGYRVCRAPHWTAEQFFNINTPEDLAEAGRRFPGGPVS